MKKFTEYVRGGLESSSQKTPEQKEAFRLFKLEFGAWLKTKGATDFKPGLGHFYISGFFTSASGQIYYFSFEDLRDEGKTSILYRTATSYKDYTGGGNQWADITDLDNTMRLK